jgi:hypothetical protein
MMEAELLSRCEELQRVSQGAGAYVRAERLSIPAQQPALPRHSNDRGLPDVRFHRYPRGGAGLC